MEEKWRKGWKTYRDEGGPGWGLMGLREVYLQGL